MALPLWFVVVSCVASIYYLMRFYFARAVYCKSNRKFHNRVAVVTGSTSGIGIEVVRDLAERGARVVLAGRDVTAAEQIIEEIAGQTRNRELSFLYLDLSSFDSVKRFVKDFKDIHDRLDILVNNAAILCPKSTTVDGFDLCQQTNVLSQLLLTELLQDRLIASAPSRVVNVVSDSVQHAPKLNMEDLNMEKDYHIYLAYASSKLQLVLLTQQLATHLKKHDVTVLGAHPGCVYTALMRHWPGLFGKYLRLKAYWLYRNANAGAQTLIYAAVNGDLEKHAGKVFFDCKVMEMEGQAADDELGGKLWQTLDGMIMEWERKQTFADEDKLANAK